MLICNCWRLHRPIFREAQDPREGREPAPWWVWAAAVITLFWGGWYLGRYGGTFSVETHVGRPGLEAFVETDEEIAAVATLAVGGKRCPAGSNRTRPRATRRYRRPAGTLDG